MDFVITLLADPAKERLTKAFPDSMAHLLSMQGVAVGKIEWLKKDTAADIFARYASLPALDSMAQDAIRGFHFDAIVQPVAHRKKRLLVADMESTIITCECLDELAELVGMRGRIESITKRAMNGELHFEEALEERVGLLKGLTESALKKVYDEKVRLMPGAHELMATMKASGAYTMLVSGGFDFFTTRVRDMLGFDEERSNRLEIKDGKLTGRVLSPVLGKKAKLKALEEACKKLKISTDDVIAIGDGANDLPMLLAAGLGVAYHAKPVVRAQAKARLNHCDLSALAWAVGG